MLCFVTAFRFRFAAPSVALLFFLLCSVFKVHRRPEAGVVENSGIEPLTS